MERNSVIYRKNLFAWEQVVRILGGALLAATPLAFTWGPAWAWIATGVFTALTGVFGFCPACYVVGRRLPEGERPKPMTP